MAIDLPAIQRRRLRTPEAAEYVGSTVSTMTKQRIRGDGPPFLKLGRTVVYDVDDLDAYLASRRRISTSEQDA